MDKMLDQIKSLGMGKIVLFLGGAAALIAVVAALLLQGAGPEYQVLYTQLSSEDSGAVIGKLKEKRVPYRVDGNTISVPSDKVYETRMELAGEGLPQGGGVGFEIFDKTSFGVTEFVQKVNYKRALQGELARTISQIKEVDSARVHLTLPEKGVFLDDQKKARASVIVKLKAGKSLSQGQVSSIVHLVANSADDLRPEDVAVVDTSGKMWTRESEADGAMELSGAQLEYKRAIEKDYEGRLQSMLEKTVGAEKVVARVSAEVDTKHVERTEEKYDPDGQVIRSEHRNKEKSIGASIASGVPGVLSNMPETAQNPVAAEASPASTQRQDEVINYEISKVTSRVIEPTGSIKRLTVSVLVDGTYTAEKGADGKEVKKYSARTDEEIARFTEMVKGAVGYNSERGDAVTVVSTPFESGVAESEAAPEKAPLIPSHLLPVLIRYATMAVIALAAIIFLIRPVVRRLTQVKSSSEAASFQHSLPGGHELSLGAGHEEGEKIERLKKVVKENPQQVAMALKGWIKEK